MAPAVARDPFRRRGVAKRGERGVAARSSDSIVSGAPGAMSRASRGSVPGDDREARAFGRPVRDQRM
jgi:hypothetical protein